MLLKFHKQSLMKIIIISFFVVFLNTALYSQKFIGFSEKDIKKQMDTDRPGFNIQNDNNLYFKYLKYVNNENTETILFFLSDKLLCTEIRIICDLSMKSQMLKELDSTYTKQNDNTWIENKNRNNYLIELNDEEWFFSINIKLEE